MGPVKQKYFMLNCYYFLIYQFKHVFWGAEKNHLIETVLLRTHSICFGWEIWKNNIQLSTFIWGPEFVKAKNKVIFVSPYQTDLEKSRQPKKLYFKIWTRIFFAVPVFINFRYRLFVSAAYKRLEIDNSLLFISESSVLFSLIQYGGSCRLRIGSNQKPQW